MESHARILRVTGILLGVAVLSVVLVYTRSLSLGHRYIDTSGKIVVSTDTYSLGHHHICLVSADGTKIVQLTKGNGNDIDPSFSPDGSQITFVSTRSGVPEVYIMDADGQGLRAVTYGSDTKTSPKFSPDGKMVAFLTHGSLMTLDLTDNETAPILPSPQAATSTSTSSLTDLATAPVLQFQWAPGTKHGHDGPIMAIQQSDADDAQVVTLLPDLSKAPVQVGAAQSCSAAWTPDGSKVVVALLGVKGAPNKLSAMFVFKPDGSLISKGPIAGTPTDKAGPQNPVFSADGQSLFFEGWNDPDAATHRVMGIFEVVSGGIQQVFPQDCSQLSFAPDNVHIAFMRPNAIAPSKNDLWLVAPGTRPVDVTGGQGDVESAEWSPALPKKSSASTR